MRLLTKDEFYLELEPHLNAILNGAIFIYPTDTIYGIGCNALDSEAVQRVREIKKRAKAPFSVLAPSKEWIEENCIIDKHSVEWLNKLPGPYTLVLKLKNKDCIAPEVIGEADTLGVRIPRHWVASIIKQVGVPIITTSVNESGKRFMISHEDLETEIRNKVHFMIDEGIKEGRPSNIVFLDKESVEIREREKGIHFPDTKKV